MAHIRDIDIDKILIATEFKPFLAEALIELDELFDENHEPVEATSHPYMKFYMRLQVEVKPGDIIRIS